MPESTLGIGFGVQMVRPLQMAGLQLGQQLDTQLENNLPPSSPVEASMKIDASSHYIYVGCPGTAPRKLHHISDFGELCYGRDVTDVFGHTFNHYHRCLSLLRSTLQEGKYHGISQPLEPVELTVCERH
jgi:hypothetical protein